MKKQEPSKILIKELIKTQIKTREDLSQLKRNISKKFKIPCPSNITLLKTYHRLLKNKSIKKSKVIGNLLKTRPVRSLSGIANITVLTKPYPCPGKCIFCPIEKGFPKGYVAGEPAAQRAKNLKFDPFLQVQKRMEMLKIQGHPTDKIELRIVGGTWSFYPKRYQTWFIKKCFDAANGKNSKNLFETQKKNEKAKNRIVGISIETRPDFITKKEIKRLRMLGITLVELGIQTVFDEVLEKCKTNITRKQITKATKLLKDSGFKILYQLMPNLPGSNIKKDIESFKIIFKNENFLPDWIKIYPCLVCENTLLYNLWKNKKYKPYSEKELIDLLIKIKTILPHWTRLTRLFRDIPSKKIKAGSKTLNLREVVKNKMKKKGISCNCIRCREVRERFNPKEKIYLFRKDYKSSKGIEIFLSFENKKRTKLFSYLRLRVNSKEKHFIPVLQGASIIREIQTFGMQIPISKKGLGAQHKGMGKKLIKTAEKITKKEFNLKKISVISGIGVREYYRKLGYKLKNTYIVKNL